MEFSQRMQYFIFTGTGTFALVMGLALLATPNLEFSEYQLSAILNSVGIALLLAAYQVKYSYSPRPVLRENVEGEEVKEIYLSQGSRIQIRDDKVSHHIMHYFERLSMDRYLRFLGICLGILTLLYLINFYNAGLSQLLNLIGILFVATGIASIIPAVIDYFMKQSELFTQNIEDLASFEMNIRRAENGFILDSPLSIPGYDKSVNLVTKFNDEVWDNMGILSRRQYIDAIGFRPNALQKLSFWLTDLFNKEYLLIMFYKKDQYQYIDNPLEQDVLGSYNTATNYPLSIYMLTSSDREEMEFLLEELYAWYNVD